MNLFRKSYDVPPPELFDDNLAITWFTDDVWNLSRRIQHNLFVCDEFLPGLPQHGYIENECTRRAAAFTKQEYCMWKKKLGEATYPIILPTTEENDKPPWSPLSDRPSGGIPAMVKGTIFSVFTSTIIKLDTVKQNGVQFRRQRVELIIPNKRIVWLKGREERGKSLEDIPTGYDKITAYMYVGIPEFWEELIDGGYMYAPVKRYVPKKGPLGPFYYFSRMELNHE